MDVDVELLSNCKPGLKLASKKNCGLFYICHQVRPYFLAFCILVLVLIFLLIITTNHAKMEKEFLAVPFIKKDFSLELIFYFSLNTF